MQKPNKGSDTILRAHVVLKPPPGEAPNPLPTASDIRRLANPDAMKEVSRQLQELGFSVLSSTPYYVTIEAPKKVYEATFGSRVIAPSPQGKSPGHTERPVPIDDVGATPIAASWAPAPMIPQGMANLVATVAFPQPVSLHADGSHSVEPNNRRVAKHKGGHRRKT